jgi:hypothetical protein
MTISPLAAALHKAEHRLVDAQEALVSAHVVATAVVARDLMVQARSAIAAAYDAACTLEPRGWEDAALTEALMNADAAVRHLTAVASDEAAERVS